MAFKFKKLPILVLSGFLGSGKTTLVQKILDLNCKTDKPLNIALIINDMGEINIDATLLGNVVKTETKIVEISNGCICCTLREDLLIEISKLAKMQKYDYLIIESSGISEPLPVAQTIDFVEENGKSLSDLAYIDNMLTVVDGKNFWTNYNGGNTVEDEKLLSGLLTEQLEFANTILITKNQDPVLRDFAIKLNPTAKILENNFKLEDVLFTKLFDLEIAQNSAGWIYELENKHIPETLEYGISSFVYTSKKMFDEVKLKNALMNEISGVFRAKGFYFICKEYIKEFTQVGIDIELGKNLAWVKPEDYHLKKQEIVFIGQNMNQQKITKTLDSCLITEANLG